MLEQQEIEFSGHDPLDSLSNNKCTITIDSNSVRLHRAILRGVKGAKYDFYLLSDIRSVHIRVNPDMWRYWVGLLFFASFSIFYFKDAAIPVLSSSSGWEFLFILFLTFINPWFLMLYFCIVLVFLRNAFCVEIGTSSGRKTLMVFWSYLPFKRQKEAAYARAKQLADVLSSRLE
jgi:hypothetical protein